jgi:PAS domain S-box-containing protein
MKLQEKTSIIIIIILIIILSLISIFVSLVSMTSYTALEQRNMLQDVDQAVNRLNDEYGSLSSIVADWGPWDDTYDFVNGNKPDYIATNLPPEAYNNLRINLVVMTNKQGEIVYASRYDLSNQTLLPVPESLNRELIPSNPLLSVADPKVTKTGILMVGGKPYIVASRPIVHSNFSGTPQGVVIMGRYLGTNEVTYLAKLTKPDLHFIPVDDPSLPREFLSALSAGQNRSVVAVIPLNNSQIAGYTLIRDVNGRDVLALEIQESRDIYQEGITTTFQYVLIVLGAGLLFGVVILLILDKLVLSRVSALSRQVHDIGNNIALSRRMRIEGSDEFSDLSQEINRMLETIEKTHDGLLQSETRFRELAELLPQVIFEMDMQGSLIFVNHAGTEIFGIDDKKIRSGVNVSEYLIPGEIERMHRGLMRVLSGTKSSGEVYNLKRLDGTLMSAIIYTAPIHRNGTVAGFRGSVIDITDRVKLEEALTESTELITGILQASPVGVFRLDPAGHVTFVNETFTKITGIPFEMIQGTYWADIFPVEERERIIKEVGESIRERKTSGAEIRYIHPDGTHYWLFGQTVPLIDKEGNLNGWVGSITNTTDQKLIADALKESEEKYRALTENTPDLLFSTDMGGIITYISPQVNKYGFLVEEVMGEPLRIFIHPADINRVESNLSRELEKNAQFVSEFRLVDKWDTIYWFEAKSYLRLDLSGKPIGIYGILRDVTERKRIEDAIDIANKKLNLMSQITRHDILNTITGVLGCVDMAKATTSPEERETLLNDIKDLTRVIQRHITFTKEYQEVGVHLPQWQNVNDLINKVVQNFAKSGIIFHSKFETMEVYADPLLEKVFYNLVDNAIRYGVTITTITIYPTISDEGFSLVFEDDGVGVEPKQKSEIFKRGVGKNTGMGLFLTKEILAITRITIEENGVFGKGARFVLRIPNGTWKLTRD